MSGKPYPKPECVIKRGSAVLQPCRTRDKVVEVPRELPCNIIVVHGVNDVGTGYPEVEEGVCAGLQDRLFRQFKSATYRVPGAHDKGELLDDPDAVFFKRSMDTDTDSPVIPFYWGFRELTDKSGNQHGQKIDRNGNRLDKDLSKGGGPFGNATSTLPDMWNRGIYSPADPARDPLRPLRTGPGRMYMVLAAQRLAALISMIRAYEPRDTVNIIAHSQGCLVSLLAQAFLMEMGQKTADTLILTHPPYGLDDGMGLVMKGVTFFKGDKEEPMKDLYKFLNGEQSTYARLKTLVNIVAGVAASKSTEPVFSTIAESSNGGAVHGRWKPDDDRDNRGKVYLYFCPEDMTVALDNMRGIGWQGVPDYIQDSRVKHQSTMNQRARNALKALAELGPTFRQRVFTAKPRIPAGSLKPAPVLVGQPPHDFILRTEGEDDHAHVADDGRTLRASLPFPGTLDYPQGSQQEQRHGIRTINGEALKSPFAAEIKGNQIDAARIPVRSRRARMAEADKGPCEEIDPIDAATAVVGSGGLVTKFEEMPPQVTKAASGRSTAAESDGLPEALSNHDLKKLTAAYNAVKRPGNDNPDAANRIITAVRRPDGSIIAGVQESPNEARLRWQQELSPKSFHSVIFGNRKNHRYVTAYDLSIGSGKAGSDPKFYACLCAVADWRLKIPMEKQLSRPRILTYTQFSQLFNEYLVCEPEWRQRLIKGDAVYYSTGVLPELPVLTGKLWDIVISETTSGMRVTTARQRERHD